MHSFAALANQPEYIHTCINHFPLIGLMVAMAFLLTALVTKNRSGVWAGLIFVGLLALSVWPVYHFGMEGYDRVLSMSDEQGQAYLRRHEDLAETWVFLFYVTAGVAVTGMVLARKWSRLLTPAAILSLLLAVASLAAGFFIAEAGGKIRHREFRTGPPPSVQE